MKTKLLLFSLFLIGLISFSQNTYVPDDQFEQFLINSGYDTGALNDSVPTVNINTITYLDVRYQSISDLTGIEDFTSLIIFYCSGNPITSIDVSRAIDLNELWCDNTELTSLNLNNNTALTLLVGHDNNLNSLIVNGAISLRQLSCENNNLTDLDVSQNTALDNLSCSNNQLNNLDVSQNTALRYLTCSNNQLTSLDLSKNTGLYGLFCSDNQLTILDVRNGNNSSLLNFNATNNPSLACIEVDNATDANNGIAPYNNWQKDNTASYSEDCGYNTEIPIAVNDEYETLENTRLEINSNNGVLSNDLDVLTATAILITDVSNGTLVLDPNGSFVYDPINDFFGTDSFTYKANNGSVDSNIATVMIIVKKDEPVTEVPDANFEQALIDLGYDNLIDGYLSNAIISEIDSLDIHYKSISDLTGIEGFTGLVSLDFTNNLITSLDISQNTELTNLKCGNNELFDLDVSQNTKLSFLECYSNNLESLNLSNNPALETLNCTGNQLETLDMSNNPALLSLFCAGNQLTSLDVLQNSSLIRLDCYNNQLSNLDLTNIKSLERLECQDNNLLTSLDVSDNYSLWLLNCSNNQLTELNVNNCTSIVDLVCYNNQLTELMVDRSTVLGGLYCQNNQLGELHVSENIDLLRLNCSYNDLLELDITNNLRLRYLDSSNNPMAEIFLTDDDSSKFNSSKISQKLAVSPNDILGHINVSETELITIDISNVPNLETLYAQSSKLTSIDVSNNNILGILNVTNNPLDCIQVSQEQIGNIPIGWEIDATASYSTDCPTSLGVDDEILAEGLKLYPNPVSDILSVESKLALKKIEIYSILGQKVKDINSDFNSISTKHLSRGIFLIKIYSEKGIAIRKLIKQ
jgi:Leucine-rich repeat (LRR) protein